MRNAIVLALAFLVGTCAACGTAPPPVQAPPGPRGAGTTLGLEQRTVALVKPGEDAPYCTGVWVTSDAFVTARHCTRGLRAGDTVGYVTRADVDEREDIVGMRVGVLVAKDAKHDLALVRDKGAPAHGVASISEPVVGRSAAAMGHSLGLWWSYSRGEVAAVRIHEFDSDGPVWWVQATTPISPGNSGGGLFDSEGSLIGIAAGILRGGESLNLFVHSRYVAALLKAEGSQ